MIGASWELRPLPPGPCPGPPGWLTVSPDPLAGKGIVWYPSPFLMKHGRRKRENEDRNQFSKSNDLGSLLIVPLVQF